jgi:hypothetical protein
MKNLLLFFVLQVCTNHFLLAQVPDFQWSKATMATNNASLGQCHDLEVDAASNCFVTGTIRGQFDFGSGITLESPVDGAAFFLVRYNNTAPSNGPNWPPSKILLPLIQTQWLIASA